MSDDTLKGVSQIYSKYISGSAEKERVKYILRSNDSEFRGTKPSGKCKRGRMV